MSIRVPSSHTAGACQVDWSIEPEGSSPVRVCHASTAKSVVGFVLLLTFGACSGDVAPSASLPSTNVFDLGRLPLSGSLGGVVPSGHPKIGSTDGHEEHQFAHLSWAAFLEDGLVAAVDRFKRSVSVFDAAGNRIVEFGRIGDGPGEYQSPNWLGFCGTSIISVFDYRLERLTEVSLDGTVLGTLRIPDTRGHVVDRIRCSPVQTYIISQRDITAMPEAEGLYQAPILLQAMTGLSGNIEPVGVFLGEDRYLYPSSDMPAPLGGRVSFAVDSNRVYVASGTEASVVEMDRLSRDTMRIIRWEPQHNPIHRGIQDAVIQADLELVRGRIPPSALKERRDAWERTMFPTHLPEVYGLKWDDALRNLWVEVSRPCVQDDGSPTLLFGIDMSGPEPVPLGVLAISEPLTVFEIRDNVVLGSLRDSTDIRILVQREIRLPVETKNPPRP